MTRSLDAMSLAASHPHEVLLVYFTDIMEEYMACETQNEKTRQSKYRTVGIYMSHTAVL